MARIRVVERARSFAPAAELALEKQDLKEICFATLTIGQRLLHATVEIARKAGVLKERVDESLIDPRPA